MDNNDTLVLDLIYIRWIFNVLFLIGHLLLIDLIVKQFIFLVTNL